MKKILIIGGCGYIGSRLSEYLRKKQYRVDTVDAEWFGNPVNKRNIKKNYSFLTKDFLNNYPLIILLAGHSSVKMCENRLISSFKNNVYNFVKLLDKLTTQKFIYASSSSIYGKTNRINVTENYNRYLPENYYDLTKKQIDYYAQLSNVNYFGLRLGTVCGYSPNLRSDLMINKMVKTAIRKKEINIFNPSVFRPVLGIEDFCRAVEVIMTKDKPKGIYNLASFNASILEVAQGVSKQLGGVKINTVGTFPGYNFSVDTKKFERTFKFKFKENMDTIVTSLLTKKPLNSSTRERAR
jgi:UDP-glucose 4-epimerase